MAHFSSTEIKELSTQSSIPGEHILQERRGKNQYIHRWRKTNPNHLKRRVKGNSLKIKETKDLGTAGGKNTVSKNKDKNNLSFSFEFSKIIFNNRIMRNEEGSDFYASFELIK